MNIAKTNILTDFYFEKVSEYPDAILPTRGTKDSAGYDFYCAKDIVIPNYNHMISAISADTVFGGPLHWQSVEALVRSRDVKTPLIPTGVKCHLPQGYYLQLSLRSSTPNKHWLIIANPPGIVDADYYNNPDNEGHIYFQVINLLPFDVKMPAGTKFGQGIVLPYVIAADDKAENTRLGGFGSTGA